MRLSLLRMKTHNGFTSVITFLVSIFLFSIVFAVLLFPLLVAWTLLSWASFTTQRLLAAIRSKLGGSGSSTPR